MRWVGLGLLLMLVGCAETFNLQMDPHQYANKQLTFIVDKRPPDSFKSDAFIGHNKHRIGADGITPDPALLLDDHLANTLPPNMKGQVELLDYKVIYDYTYGDSPSHSFDFACDIKAQYNGQEYDADGQGEYQAKWNFFSVSEDDKTAGEALRTCINRADDTLAHYLIGETGQ